MKSWDCFDCHLVFMAQPDDVAKCPSCGKTNGEVISAERLEEGHRAGVYFDIDLRTGKRAKKARR